MGRVDAPVVSLGNKGVCYLELHCRTANTDFHSSFAEVYPNAAWRLVQALGTIKDPATGRVLVEGFYDKVRPLDADEQEIVDKLPPVDAEERKQMFGITGLANGIDGKEAARRIAIWPTCNIAGLLSGYVGEGRKTVTPSEAMARIDCRLVVDQDADEIRDKFEAHLRKHGFPEIEVELVSKGRPSRSAVKTRLNRVIARASREVYGKEAIFEPCQGGGTPVWVGTEVLGIPVASTGVGYVSAVTHAPDENIDLGHLIEGAKYMATIIARFGEKEAS
jgi:acetylornithine deacetylase/succinyl-diaminopimelate desuccinylase-like protein